MKQENKKPEWVEAACQWQNENTDTRSILIIAADENGMINVAHGAPMLIINSIFQSLQQNPTVAQFIKDAQKVAKGGIAEHLFAKEFTEYAKEHGIEVKDANPPENLFKALDDHFNK